MDNRLIALLIIIVTGAALYLIVDLTMGFSRPNNAGTNPDAYLLFVVLWPILSLWFARAATKMKKESLEMEVMEKLLGK